MCANERKVPSTKTKTIMMSVLKITRLALALLLVSTFLVLYFYKNIAFSLSKFEFDPTHPFEGLDAKHRKQHTAYKVDPSKVTDVLLENRKFTGKAVDPSKITHVYHLGYNHAGVGRFNNEWIAILHAIDRALIEHGDPPNNRAVVALYSWSMETVKELFYNPQEESETEFSQRLELTGLVVAEDRLQPLGLEDTWLESIFGPKKTVTHVWLDSWDAFYFVQDNREVFTPSIVKNRRKLILDAFLQQFGFAKQNLVQYNILMGHIHKQIQKRQPNLSGEMKNNSGYVAIHSRWLEGQCERRVSKPFVDECWMRPSYVKEIIGTTIDKPIVFIWDGQNQDVLDSLKNDSEIGPALIVCEEDLVVPKGVDIPQPLSDFMVGIMSDIFIGTRASSFAANIGVFREALGRDPTTNKIYTIPGKLDSLGVLKVCEDCLYLCNEKLRMPCGHSTIYP